MLRKQIVTLARKWPPVLPGKNNDPHQGSDSRFRLGAFCPYEDGADRERKTAGPRGGKGKMWTEAGHFTAHTSHNRKEELSGGDKVRLQRGQPEEAQKSKPLASVFTMHVQ